jgi:hypothetical protein
MFSDMQSASVSPEQEASGATLGMFCATVHSGKVRQSLIVLAELDLDPFRPGRICLDHDQVRLLTGLKQAARRKSDTVSSWN